LSRSAIEGWNNQSVLRRFKDDSRDGTYPFAALVGVNDSLYGTTPDGGAHGCGTIFCLKP
jgi:hypothetical protein